MAADQKPASKSKAAEDKPQEAPAAAEEQVTEEEAQKRSEEAVTRAANARKEAAALELYGHLRHSIGAEVSIDHARQIVEMVETALAPEED